VDASERPNFMHACCFVITRQLLENYGELIDIVAPPTSRKRPELFEVWDGFSDFMKVTDLRKTSRTDMHSISFQTTCMMPSLF
jgi:hypothetical protein